MTPKVTCFIAYSATLIIQDPPSGEEADLRALWWEVAELINTGLRHQLLSLLPLLAWQDVLAGRPWVEWHLLELAHPIL